MSGTEPPPVGVLVMAHGTPGTPGEIEPFYTRIRRGRPPTPEALAELVGRYEAIGGTSPLAERTRAQVDGLAAALDAREPGRYRVRFGSKHTAPSIEEGVAALIADGVRELIGIVLAPHESGVGSGEYFARAEKAAAGSPSTPDLIAVRWWHRAPGLAAILADRTAAALDALPVETRKGARVLFTAHSVPLRTLSDDDAYPVQVAESGADVAARLGFDGDPGHPWGVAWQSAGRTPDPWLGPDLLAEIRRAAAEGAHAVVVCPVGFVADHLETLYDLDVEAARVAREAGVAFARTEALDDDPRFLRVLAGVVRSAAAASSGVGGADGRDPATAVS